MADEEGWYTDPYGRHEARWMSAGKPTRLVRDGTREGSDEPPDEAPTSAPMPVGWETAAHGEDLQRADEAERDEPSDPQRLTEEAWESFPHIGTID